MSTEIWSVLKTILCSYFWPAFQKTISLPAVLLARNGKAFLKVNRHPLLHKHVQINQGGLKEYTGFIAGVNHVKHKFLVDLDFNGMQTLLNHEDFTEIDCNAHMRSSTPPACFSTPIPMSPLLANDDPDRAAWGVSPQPGEYALISSSYVTEYCLLEPLGPWSFLVDEICTRVTTHHIWPTLGPGIAHGNRQGHTTIPILFDNTTRPSKILLYFTDNKGRWVKDYCLLSELKPAPPTTAKKEVIILDGAHKGHIATVYKFKKPEQVAIFKVDGTEWHEPLNNLCLLAAHLPIRCNCERQMLFSAWFVVTHQLKTIIYHHITVVFRACLEPPSESWFLLGSITVF